MRHQGDPSARTHASDIEEVVAVALGRVVLDRGVDQWLQEDVSLESFQQLGRRLDLRAGRPAAGAEMAELHSRVENAARVAARLSKIVTAIEQQMSAECMPGWIASLVAATPPTGIAPSRWSEGQASGMTAPATTVGTRISSSIWRDTASILARSASSSASMLAVQRKAREARSGMAGGGAKRSRYSRACAGSAKSRPPASPIASFHQDAG